MKDSVLFFVEMVTKAVIMNCWSLVGEKTMFKWLMVFSFFMMLAVGCASSGPNIKDATTIEDIDFNYDVVWKVTVAAINRYFGSFEECDKGKPVIVTGLQEAYGEETVSGVEYADQAQACIEQRGSRYFIHIRVDRFERPKGIYSFEYEGWRWLCRNLDMEVKIKDEFDNQIRQEQRVWQGHEKFKEKMRQ